MMSLKAAARAKVILVRPGATAFDEQGRMKGSLDMPMCQRGREQAENLAEELAGVRLHAVYHAPCESAGETAALLVEGRELRPKAIDAFRNIDHGLWHGKLIDEIRRNQPRLYRSGAENPETVCPPNGESMQVAAARAMKAINRVLRKSRNQVIALVIPDPLASLVAAHLNDEAMPDIWKVQADAGHWQLIEAEC
ncbi:histidine phosphatase family protein [Allorhodopirellula heiligendammensis]|uniref:Phosphoserine phosphatase 1 n=1 Tax=Allorhodopirellula heiligendammensis TaxID=2714739 RepID=A0A5C6BG07_9BACT|nr:histidine phosphatase family protein [Allorhodopirellula heiligendammensis]TWU11115.1 Phosphoserine phosphatase 1 [Allorhodopirellula heiligendammensis]